MMLYLQSYLSALVKHQNHEMTYLKVSTEMFFLTRLCSITGNALHQFPASCLYLCPAICPKSAASSLYLSEKINGGKRCFFLSQEMFIFYWKHMYV